jgi:hypothetical protein
LQRRPERRDNKRVKARLVLITAVILVFVSVAEVRGAPIAPSEVTLNFARFYSNICNCYRARVSGQISSSAAGEDVVILRQYCGRSFGTSVAGTQTRDGGFYDTEVPFVAPPDGLISESYRARWKDSVSEPVVIKGKLNVVRKRLRGGRSRIVVSSQNVNPQDMNGRQIVLQRQSGNDWVRIASARLVPHPVLYYTFVATFKSPGRGQTLRALVPSRSAAPCFTSSASEKWTS